MGGMATAVASLETPAPARTLPDTASMRTLPAAQGLSGRRKAAILLTVIGNQASAAILRQLTKEEVHDITREISLLPSATEDERQSVLGDFVTKAEHPDNLGLGGIEYATSVLLAAFGPETGKRMAERLLNSISTETPDIDSLRKADPQHLAKIVQREHPQTIALIMCHLGTGQAAKLLSELPAALRSDVARRMAALDQISPEVFNRIAKIIGGKLRLAGESSLEAYGGVRTLAEVLNQVDNSTTEEILQSIGNEDPTLGETIRHLMFIFEDLLNVSQDSMRTLIGRIDRKLLTTALKGGSPKIKAHFTSLMSGRAKEMFEEDMQALGPVRIKDVEEAQQKIITVARQLQTEGVISLSPAGAEQFVE
jgi:flagellar motor switch protein FliG